ncbi:MAG TPA: hydroxymethylglutaryl-CoA synthase [Polyangiaceae bacterium]|nr:hydroxymethylglutaryl-CoA synthase [Polyangiaceae bacterium]
MMYRPVGIEKLRVYPGSLALDIRTLCKARGMDAERTASDLMIDQRSVNPPWEDAVTMGVNAAEAMLSEEDRKQIGLLLVGTESSVDQEKPVSSWVHHFLRLPNDCLNLEVKHACFAATGALELAKAWLNSPVARGRKALIVSTDQTTLVLGESWEPVCGAGAAAVLLSTEPRLIEYETGRAGVYAHEVSDVIRPNMRHETGNSETSLFAYLQAVEGAYENYRATVGEDIDFDKHFARVLYHTPFAGMTYRAHRALLNAYTNLTNKETRAHYEKKTLPAVRHNRRMGATYGASTFIGLLGLLDSDPGVMPGDRLGLFAYGSGSCAQFYSAKLCEGAREIAQRANLGALLDARRLLSVEEYEMVERIRDEHVGVELFTPDFSILGDWYNQYYRDRHLLVLRGIQDYYRDYAWS